MAKIVYNSVIPFEGYKCVNVFGVLFVRKGRTLKFKDINHEAIHTRQMREMLFVLFYVWYGVEWFVKWCVYRDAHRAYREIGFEREAYKYEWFSFYPDNRKHFAWWREVWR